MNKEKTLQAVNLGCKRQSRLLFSDISFKLTKGELLLVEGPNGSGKSSLLRMLTGLATPSVGSIFWEEQSIADLRAIYWQNLHYISHSNGMKLELTVCENLQLASYLSLKKVAIESVLSLLNLNTFKNTQVRYLSAGQKRRISLAKLLLFPKTLWILDEPLTAFDAATQAIFLDCLQKHLKIGGIAIISSHHSISIKDVVVKNLRLLC